MPLASDEGNEQTPSPRAGQVPVLYLSERASHSARAAGEACHALVLPTWPPGPVSNLIRLSPGVLLRETSESERTNEGAGRWEVTDGQPSYTSLRSREPIRGKLIAVLGLDGAGVPRDSCAPSAHSCSEHAARSSAVFPAANATQRIYRSLRPDTWEKTRNAMRSS